MFIMVRPVDGRYDSRAEGAYLKAKVPAEQRVRMTKFLQNWTAGLHGVGTWHGAGSTVTQRIAIGRLADLEAKKRMAQRLAGLHEDPTRRSPEGGSRPSEGEVSG